MNIRVFVLTDNEFLCKRFKKIIEELNINQEFDFYCSPGNLFNDIAIEAFDIKRDFEIISNNYSLAFSIHSKQLFPEQLVKTIPCFNVHPGYNPNNRGWYPQVFAILENNIIGATIHVMDKELDNGEIIARKKVKSFVWDTSETLYNRILDAEIDLLRNNLIAILVGKYSTFKPEIKGRLYLKKDFHSLCEIRMDQKGTFQEFYDHLRALSHGNHKNAYFFDRETGEKLYLKITITK